MTPEEYTAYDNQLKTLLKEGHIKLLPNDCIPQTYLPHRGVVKLDRATTKLRIVHDASAKSEGGLSLKDALEKGPNLLSLLWGIILRFQISKFLLEGFQILLLPTHKRIIHLTLQDVMIDVIYTNYPLLDYLILVAKLYIWDCRRNLNLLV